MKIVTAHQPAYLPWLGLIHKISLCDVYVFLDNVQFKKNSFMNRNKIKTSNESIWLTIPIKIKNHLNKTMEKIEIDNSLNWRKKHWKSICINYGKTPYFDDMKLFLEDIYEKEWFYLRDITEYMLKWILDKLDINIEFIRGSDLNLTKKGSELIVELTKKVNGDWFIFGEQGTNYIDKDIFDENKINVFIQKYKHPVYPQVYGEFISHLTVFDLIANVGIKESKSFIIQDNIEKFEMNYS